MLELINMHPDEKDPKHAMSIYIITRNGSDYNDEGITYVRESIKEHGDERPMNIFTGMALNSPKMLKDRLSNDACAAYTVLSTKDDVIFIPGKNNHSICDNIDEILPHKPDATSWEILMESCKQEIY